MSDSRINTLVERGKPGPKTRKYGKMSTQEITEEKEARAKNELYNEEEEGTDHPNSFPNATPLW